MSSAARAAAEFLQTNPTREAVLAEIEANKTHLVWIDKAMGPGMDAGTRSTHMTQTRIIVLEYWLETGRVAKDQFEVYEYRRTHR